MTDKQRRFVEAYLGEAYFNATEAARIAGYKPPKQRGWDLKQHPEIAAAIRQHLDASAMSAEEVLMRLADQARGADRWIKTLGQGRAYIDVEQMLSDGKGHLIKGIKYTDGGQCIVELYDGQAALIQLGRHHQLFTDGLQLYSKMTDAELIAEAKRLFGGDAEARSDPAAERADT